MWRRVVTVHVAIADKSRSSGDGVSIPPNTEGQLKGNDSEDSVVKNSPFFSFFQLADVEKYISLIGWFEDMKYTLEKMFGKSKEEIDWDLKRCRSFSTKEVIENNKILVSIGIGDFAL